MTSNKLYGSLPVYVLHLPSSTMEMDDWKGKYDLSYCFPTEIQILKDDLFRWLFSVHNVCATYLRGCDSEAIKTERGRRLLHSLRAFCSLKSPRRASSSARPSSPRWHVYVSAERRPTFSLMMSVTQLTCASLFSQQKCLRREESGLGQNRSIGFSPR